MGHIPADTGTGVAKIHLQFITESVCDVPLETVEFYPNPQKAINRPTHAALTEATMMKPFLPQDLLAPIWFVSHPDSHNVSLLQKEHKAPDQSLPLDRRPVVAGAGPRATVPGDSGDRKPSTMWKYIWRCGRNSCVGQVEPLSSSCGPQSKRHFL